MARRSRPPRAVRAARTPGTRRGQRTATIVLSLLALVGIPVLVVALASGESAAPASQAGKVEPGGSDPHRPSAPFFANAGEGVRPRGIGCVGEGPIVARARAHLDVFADGAPVRVPAGIGAAGPCTYWLHTDAGDGVIAVTSPERRVFTLGDLFDIWGAPLTRSRVLGFDLGPGRRLRAFVDGRSVQGNPRAIHLADRREIALVIGRQPSVVPADFAFPRGG
jgi:hypothetical protein